MPKIQLNVEKNDSGDALCKLKYIPLYVWLMCRTILNISISTLLIFKLFSAFRGEYADHKEEGTYTCVVCGAPLFM